MAAIESENMGICPKCHSEDLEYPGERIFSGEQFYMDFRCNSCGAKGKEWYRIVPAYISVEEPS